MTDCCDGSDEHGSEANCPNNCREMGKEAMKETLEMIKSIEEGAKVRAELIKAAEEKRKESAKEFETLKKELEVKDAALKAAQGI